MTSLKSQDDGDDDVGRWIKRFRALEDVDAVDFIVVVVQAGPVESESKG